MPSPRSRTPTAKTRARGSRSERGAEPVAERPPVEVEAPRADDATRDAPVDLDVEPEATAAADVRAAAVTPEVRLANALVPTDSLQRYLAEIRKIPLLSREEEHRLAVRWVEQQDRQAAVRLVTGNLRLVVMIAREYHRAFHNLLDLVQEGNVGLLEAVKQFDPYRGVRFPSYAVWWIRAYIIRYIMNNWRMVKIGTTQAQRKLFFNLQKERDRLEREGFTAEPKLIAQNLAVREREVVEMQQRLSGRDASLDSPLQDGEDATLLDFLPSREQTADAVADEEYHRLVRETASRFRETLSGKDLVVFERRLAPLMRDEEPVTLQEIGDEFGITRERVRQIEARVKRKLGDYLREQIPDIKDIEFGA
jgi:RNA polymerase sigma-32 factor